MDRDLPTGTKAENTQSTWTMNILPRIILYLAQQWKEYIVATSQNVYASKKIELPCPEFYVLFTGKRKNKPETLTLSEQFFKGKEVGLDVKVKILYGTEKGTDIISQYVEFTKIYKEQYAKYGREKKTIQETIHICKEKDILKEYLEDREKEVTDIMAALFDEETIMKAYGKELREEGVSFGRMQEKKEMSLSLSGMGMPLEQIAEAAKVSINTVREWLSEAPVAAK